MNLRMFLEIFSAKCETLHQTFVQLSITSRFYPGRVLTSQNSFTLKMRSFQGPIFSNFRRHQQEMIQGYS